MPTTGDWIRTFQQYPPDTLMVFRGPAITFDTPHGNPARPLFTWPDDPHSLKVGDRVRKPGYDDTGTIIDPSKRLETRLLSNNDRVRTVLWGRTGWSVERIEDLGLAVE